MLWQKVSPLPSPDPLSPYAHLSNKGRSHNNYTTHHEASLMVCYTTLVLSLEMRIGPACEAGFSAGMRREHVPPRRRKKERSAQIQPQYLLNYCVPVSEVASRQQLRSASRHQLLLIHDIVSEHSAVGLLLWLARRSGTHWQMNCELTLVIGLNQL